MEKFEDVYERWEQRQLSQAEAAEILGKSERQFRRYIDRYEARGIEGLRDGRLGRASGKAIAAVCLGGLQTRVVASLRSRAMAFSKDCKCRSIAFNVRLEL